MIAFTDEHRLIDGTSKRVIVKAAKETLAYLNKLGNMGIISLSEADMRETNLAYRNVDRVTDVLSFPAMENGVYPPDGYFGDILLCPVRAREQALLYGHSLMRELGFLTIHGTLHLLGYDHEEENEEFNMRNLQTILLERMKLT